MPAATEIKPHGVVRTVASVIWRSTMQPVLRLLRPVPSGERHVLFACHNALTASYLAEVWALLREDPRLRFYVVLPHDATGLEQRSAVQEYLPLRVIGTQAWANVLPWSLVIMADHAGGFKPLAQPWRHPVLRISHGIGGKQVRGEDYFYGRRARDNRGRLIYSRMFESSEGRRQAVLATDPELGSRIAVVGSRRADLMAEAVTAARRRTAEATHRTGTALLASSWGTGNLFATLGAGLLDEAERLKGKWDFVLRPHPHLLSKGICSSTDFVRLFEQKQRPGFRFSPPTESLADAVAAADVVVIDDLSSVGLLAALAGANVVIVPSGSSAVGDNTFLVQLRERVPNLTTPEQLGPVLERACKSAADPQLAALLRNMNSEPSNSAPRMRRELYRLLNMSEPVSPGGPL